MLTKIQKTITNHTCNVLICCAWSKRSTQYFPTSSTLSIPKPVSNVDVLFVIVESMTYVLCIHITAVIHVFIYNQSFMCTRQYRWNHNMYLRGRDTCVYDYMCFIHRKYDKWYTALSTKVHKFAIEIICFSEYIHDSEYVVNISQDATHNSLI